MKLATVADAVNHIQHVVDIIGIDHVGIGSDFDGGGGIEGLHGCFHDEEHHQRAYQPRLQPR
ncbi:MAG: dipeptidase [Marinilabiliales bacterium]|nr:dipeptidase [Marinilabiliales bacterium]